MSGHIWSCKIGEGASIPDGADLPMRRAVQDAYFKLTGSEPVFCFSGWGAKLSEGERAVVENREPRPELTDEARIRAEERAAFKAQVLAVLGRMATLSRPDILAAVEALGASKPDDTRPHHSGNPRRPECTVCDACEMCITHGYCHCKEARHD